MIRSVNAIVLLFCSIILASFMFYQKKKITVYLVGDSTMSIKEPEFFPETGWGMPFAYFFDSTVVLDNRAKNGRSTKSFIEENLWKPITDNLHAGDYVFIQFGHNDEVKEKIGRYTTLEEFKTNLLRFVNDTKNKKAIPVLLTPVARRRFGTTGKVEGSHPFYSDAVREIATNNKTTLIDLDKESQELLNLYGADFSKQLFLHLQPNEHPNYPAGTEDNTHFSELGARKIAQIVLAEIKKLKLELGERIVKR